MRRQVAATKSSPRQVNRRITLTGKYRYPPQVIAAFMQGCTQGKQARENLCACVIDKLSYTMSSRDFARVAPAERFHGQGSDQTRDRRLRLT